MTERMPHSATLPWRSNRLSFDTSAESTACCVRTTRSMSDRLRITGPICTAAPNLLARTTSRCEFGSISSKKPRSARGKIRNRPSRVLGSTSSSPTAAPMARSSSSDARSMLPWSTPDSSGRCPAATAATIIGSPSSSTSAVTPDSPSAIGLPAGRPACLENFNR